MTKLYKYAGPGALLKILPDSSRAVFRCSFPNSFNDPYELFLSINLDEGPDLLAFYADVIGELPQLPTTCFSRSPAVLPMWAHYAQNLEGFAVEVEEERLQARYAKSGFGDIDYRDSPDPQLNTSLGLAHVTTKPRHTFFLRKAVFSAAYYTKATCWANEEETRMIVATQKVKQQSK